MKLIFVCFLLMFACSTALSANIETLRAELDSVVNFDDLPEETRSSFEYLLALNKTKPKLSGGQTRAPFECNDCKLAVQGVLSLRRLGVSTTVIISTAITLCENVLSFSYATCSGLVNLNVDILIYIVDNRPQLDAETVCAVLLQDECHVSDDRFEWSINIDWSQATPVTPKYYIPASQEDQNLQIVHITDTHHDPHYRMGMNAACGQPLCCRLRQGAPEFAEDAAGYWGDYRSCDAPWVAIEDLFQHVEETHKNIDYIYVTGDYNDHGIWESTLQENKDIMDQTFNAMKSNFRNIPIYPSFGNHEANPTNQFAPWEIDNPSLSTRSLYEHAANTWYWLPESAKVTIRQGGYYTALVRPGLRIVVLNSNDCYILNWWLLYDFHHPSIQLNWLYETLLAAEANQEKVHILAHIPTGTSDNFKTCSREYARLVERFWDTISAQFNGHTHKDRLYIYYASGNRNIPINVAWDGGSATPYSNVNPNYRVLSVEQNTYQVVEHETYIYNLTLANQLVNTRPQWFKEYSFRTDYQLSDLSPASLDALTTEFANNRDKLYTYWQRVFKMGDPTLRAGCDNECLLGELCGIVHTEFGAPSPRCDTLTDIFQSHN